MASEEPVSFVKESVSDLASSRSDSYELLFPDSARERQLLKHDGPS